MAEIKAISSNIQISKTPISPAEREHRKQQQEQVAAGVGGAAGLSTTATRVAGKKGMKVGTLENELNHVMEKVHHTTQAVNKNSKAATGLWAEFKANIQMFTRDISERLGKLKLPKFVKSVMESPLGKKLIGFTGGALAFFVLITGVNKAVKTGAIAVDDFKQQYHEFNAAA